MLRVLKKTIKRYILPYRPLQKNKLKWDKEYSNGKWHYLNNTKDGMRYNIIVNYIRDNFSKSVSILDLGCGSGILQQKLSDCYSYFEGIDISDEAINMAKSNENECTRFLQADLTEFTPDKMFDCIIFNESLYYIDNPLKTLEKFNSFLKENGIIIISMWDYRERNNKLWKLINSLLVKIDGMQLKFDSGNSWYIRFYQKAVSIYFVIESSLIDLYFLGGDLPILG